MTKSIQELIKEKLTARQCFLFAGDCAQRALNKQGCLLEPRLLFTREVSASVRKGEEKEELDKGLAFDTACYAASRAATMAWDYGFAFNRIPGWGYESGWKHELGEQNWQVARILWYAHGEEDGRK